MSEKCPACIALNNICKRLNDKKCDELAKKLDEINKLNLPESEKEKLYKQIENEFIEYFNNKAKQLGPEFFVIVSDSIKEVINNKK
jgi:hypothetical protein